MSEIYGRGHYHSDAEFSKEFDLLLNERLQGIHLNSMKGQRSEKSLTFDKCEKTRKNEKNGENERK